MLKSHFIITVRNMMRHKFYSFINILGLSFAIALVILVMLFVRSEFSQDNFHQNSDTVYRVYTKKVNAESQEVISQSATISIPLVRQFEQEFDQIQRISRFGSNSGVVLKSNTPYKQSIHFVDPEFFEMFSFPVVRGNSGSPISELNDLVISPEMALKYFGDADPIGQTLKIKFGNKGKDYRVSAVVDPMDSKSSITFDLVLHIEQFRDVVGEDVFKSNVYGLLDGFIQLEEKVLPNQLEAQLTDSYNRGSAETTTLSSVHLQPLESIYLDDEIPQSMLSVGNSENSYILIGLALLVLVIAVINFITLSTGHALNRVKEIGVRKAVGAIRNQLRAQLIVEAFFITLISGFIGILLAFMALPYFNELAESSLLFSFSMFEAVVFVGVILLVALISGFMQSGVLIRIKASEAVRGKMISAKGGKHFFSKVLIVIQFSLSIALIVGTMVMRNQLVFMGEKNLGYDRERLIQIETNDPESAETSVNMLELYRTAIISNPNIIGVTGTMNKPHEPWTRLGFPQEDGSREGLFYNQVDPGYLETMKMELVLGNDFDQSSAFASQNEILVNEALVKYFGWEDPLNEQIPGRLFQRNHQIVGVVKDFHFSDLKQKIEPLIIATSYRSISSGVQGLSTYQWPPKLNQIVVRVSPGELQPVIEFMEQAWQGLNPESPFLMKFVDDVLDDLYKSETRWGKIIDSASIIAILIAWLGLLGLTRLAVQKRIKEIGIRKVLGSSVPEVIMLLSKGILLLIILANLIAWPAAWFISEQWLQDFQYKIDLNILMFGLVGLAVVIFALISVGAQVFKTAASNPVKSLRYD